MGEELPFFLESTVPPHWAKGTSIEAWRRERGKVIRIAVEAEHNVYGSWTLPGEIDLGDDSAGATIYLPQP
ncbi:MAG TPA: hypothetical protein VG317_16380 [Pseudonocardiaceae bacterium]|nr:hypothetical protein [Pseudonocardiaceae bacterium]